MMDDGKVAIKWRFQKYPHHFNCFTITFERFVSLIAHQAETIQYESVLLIGE